MRIPIDERDAKRLLMSRGYIVVKPIIVKVAAVEKSKENPIDIIFRIIGNGAEIGRIAGVSRATAIYWKKHKILPMKARERILDWVADNAPEYYYTLDKLINEAKARKDNGFDD